MPARIQQGTVIFRSWDRQTGVAETATPITTLSDLFELCLQADDPLLVDRVIVQGTDDDGAQRIVTFVLQSVTVSGGGEAPHDA